MNLPTLAVRRPITTAMILVSILLVGGIAFVKLPLAFLPEVDAPFMFVQIPYQNSHPRQIEREITKPVEETLSTLSGVMIFSGIRVLYPGVGWVLFVSVIFFSLNC